MARILLSSNLKPFTGGTTEVEIDAANVRQLFQALETRFPALKPYLDAELMVAIDGEIYQDSWFQPIAGDSEVHVLPKIAGG